MLVASLVSSDAASDVPVKSEEKKEAINAARIHDVVVFRTAKTPAQISNDDEALVVEGYGRRRRRSELGGLLHRSGHLALRPSGHLRLDGDHRPHWLRKEAVPFRWRRRCQVPSQRGGREKLLVVESNRRPRVALANGNTIRVIAFGAERVVRPGEALHDEGARVDGVEERACNPAYAEPDNRLLQTAPFRKRGGDDGVVLRARKKLRNHRRRRRVSSFDAADAVSHVCLFFVDVFAIRG